MEILSLADITSNNKLIQRTLLAISSNIQEIMKMEVKVKSIPLHLFKKVLQNENLLIRNSHGVVLSKSAGKMILTDICNNYSDLNHLGEKDREDLLEVTKIEDRGLQLTFWKSNSLGEAPDGPQVERNFSCQGNGVKFIQRIALKTVLWANRLVIGKMLRWSPSINRHLALILFVGVLVLKLAHVPSIVHLYAYCAAMYVLLLVLTRLYELRSVRFGCAMTAVVRVRVINHANETACTLHLLLHLLFHLHFNVMLIGFFSGNYNRVCR